jgi:hypothetical protein
MLPVDGDEVEATAELVAMLLVGKVVVWLEPSSVVFSVVELISSDVVEFPSESVVDDNGSWLELCGIDDVASGSVVGSKVVPSVCDDVVVVDVVVVSDVSIISVGIVASDLLVAGTEVEIVVDNVVD